MLVMEYFKSFLIYFDNLRHISEMLQLIHVYYMPWHERDAILKLSERLRGVKMPFFGDLCRFLVLYLLCHIKVLYQNAKLPKMSIQTIIKHGRCVDRAPVIVESTKSWENVTLLASCESGNINLIG